MKKRVMIVILNLILIILFSNLINAQLTVTKLAENTNISVDSNLKVLLKFNNYFGKALPIQIQSKDTIGGNGYDIECYEFNLPADPEIVLQLSEIQASAPGNFTLDVAKVKFTNPRTGQEEVIVSETLNVTVNGEYKTGTITESITKIYQCDGQSQQSQQSKTTSSEQQKKEQEQQQEEQQKQHQQQQKEQQQNQQEQKESKEPEMSEKERQEKLDEMQKKMDKVQNNQMSQDSNALKNQMQKQVNEQKELSDEFEKSLQENEEFKQKKEELEKQGFKQSDKSINPENNNTGDFEYEYKNDKGESAKIKGDMKDGKMENMESQSSLESQKMQDLMKNNSEFQDMQKELSEMGFNKTDFDYKSVNNKTQATMTYENELGEKANITAQIQNETIKKIDLNNPNDKKKKKLFFWIALIWIILFSLSLWYYLSKKYGWNKKQSNLITTKPEKPFDYTSESNKLLKNAETKFKQKKYKDAYGLASESLRLFCSYKHDVKKELTATETIKLLKKKRKPFTNSQKCLNLCGLVEFAKYEPNKKDFSAIVGCVKKELEK